MFLLLTNDKLERKKAGQPRRWYGYIFLTGGRSSLGNDYIFEYWFLK